MTPAEAFCRNLNTLMSKNNVSTAKLATAIGVGISTVSSWRTGKMFPRIEKIGKIAEYFNISSNDLLIDNNDILDTKEDKSLDLEYKIKELSKSIAYNKLHIQNLQKEFETEWDNNPIRRLLSNLNEAGYNKAIDYIELLLKVPEYRIDPYLDSSYDKIKDIIDT